MTPLAFGLVVLATALSPLTAVAAASAQRGNTRPGVTEGDFVMRDVAFSDGSTLPELRIHYATLGRPRREADGKVHNAVLILHGTTGSGTGFLGANFGGQLSGPGQLLVPRRRVRVGIVGLSATTGVSTPSEEVPRALRGEIAPGWAGTGHQSRLSMNCLPLQSHGHGS